MNTLGGTTLLPQESGVDRRLAAIVAVDVVGYSRLMGADEAGTLAAVQSVLNKVIEPKAAQYKGRVVKLMGDGALLEFASVVDATVFAIELQVAMQGRNARGPDDHKIVYRIGINLGDIIVRDDDIFGDGVNIAARLEALAEPGGICLSRSAYDQVADKLDIAFEDLNENKVKNIEKPVRVFRVVLDERAAALATPLTAGNHRPTRRLLILSAASLIGLALLVAVVWWQPWVNGDLDTASSSVGLPLPDKPSIAVLPFDDLSDDPAQAYFANGLTEDLITNLSLYRELMVISRESTFAYTGEEVDVRAVGHDLGVAFVVEGSVQREQDQVRVNVRLVDAASGEQLWAERFDRQLTDIFAVQDEITQNVAGRLLPEVTQASVARAQHTPTENLRAWDLFLRARAAQEVYNLESQTEAIRLARLAIEQDPDFAGPYSLIARAQGLLFFYQWADIPEESLDEAIENAKTAIRLDASDAEAYAALGYVYRLTGDDAQAIANLSRAAELNPNSANIRLELAHTLDWFRQQERALPEILEALRLSPRDPRLQVMLFYKAHILFHLGRYEESLDAADEMSAAISAEYWQIFYHLVRAADFAQLGRSEEALAEIERARALNPGLSLAAIERRFEGSHNHPDNRRAWLDALRLAGMPEE